MSNKSGPTKQGLTTIEYVKKFVDMPTKTLARKLYTEHPELYLTVESARTSIRYYRGKSGDGKRQVVEKTNHAALMDTEQRPFNPFDALPEGIKSFSDLTPYAITGEMVLSLADIHLPYHDKTALMAAIDHGKRIGVDTILLNGDILDFWSISRWDKDPTKKDFRNEVEVSAQFFKLLRETFPDAEILWKIGNHEERFEKYMQVKAPELLSLDYFNPKRTLQNLFDLKNLGIKVVGDKRVVRVGQLNILHGHELNGASTSVNPARGVFLKAGVNLLVAHWHKTSTHMDRNLNGKLVACWSQGCLCDMAPDYARFNKWNQGCAIIERDRTLFRVHNHQIIDGEVL